MKCVTLMINFTQRVKTNYRVITKWNKLKNNISQSKKNYELLCITITECITNIRLNVRRKRCLG
jgi:hypothetical protein